MITSVNDHISACIPTIHISHQTRHTRDYVPFFICTFFITILCSNKFTQIYLHTQNKRLISRTCFKCNYFSITVSVCTQCTVIWIPTSSSGVRLSSLGLFRPFHSFPAIIFLFLFFSLLSTLQYLYGSITLFSFFTPMTKPP